MTLMVIACSPKEATVVAEKVQHPILMRRWTTETRLLQEMIKFNVLSTQPQQQPRQAAKTNTVQRLRRSDIIVMGLKVKSTSSSMKRSRQLLEVSS